MKKMVKVSLLSLVGVAMVVPTMTTPVDAASKVKVLSTKKVTKRAYHSTKGNVYSSAKLTHRKYQMKNYKYTTWYSYKKSVIKQNGKKRTYFYVKTGKKAGWIYSKSLKAGKAPAAKRVLSTVNLTPKAYHGTKGNIYNTPTLSKRVYQLKNYKHTTWYANQQAVVSVKGKKRTYLHVTAGNKSGWIYSKSLKAGKASVNKAARLKTTYIAYKKASLTASDNAQSYMTSTYMDYYYMGEDIQEAFSDPSEFDFSGMDSSDYATAASQLNKDKVGVLNLYNVFKGRFSGKNRQLLDSQANTIQSLTFTTNNIQKGQEITNFAHTLGDLVQNLD